MYGAQAICLHIITLTPFENDVEMYGAQAVDVIITAEDYV